MTTPSNLSQLHKTLVTMWNADANAEAARLATGGFWCGMAPPDTVAPYVTFIPLGGQNEQATGIDRDRATFQFMVHVSGDDELSDALDIADAIKDGFDNRTSGMDGDLAMVYCKRLTTGNAVKDPDEGWNVVVEYEVMYG
jgi:hypothetical protein